MTLRSSRLRGRAVACALLGLVAPALPAAANDLADLSLEELSGIEVTSVSRRAERLSEAAASVYVITGEQIRRSGAASLPEALRLAPNLQVAQLGTGQYAISARGFNNAIGNKLLVLIDGRTVYSPVFSGVFWDQQDVMLADVDRIEVISGPGASIWGSNAVNGVINVITLPAAQTQGTLVAAEAGNRSTELALRHGGALGGGGHWRAYAKASQLENTRTAAGASLPDDWERQQAGLRADWRGAGGNFTLQGDAYQGRAEHRGFFGRFELRPIDVSGANLLARWTRQFDGGSDLRVQAYHDHSRRSDALLYSPEVATLDLEFQHGIPVGRHRLLWGGGYRRARDEIQPGVFFAYVPASRTMSWKNLFAQGDIDLGDKFDLSLGVKLENNGYTGTEVLPSLRMGWKVAKDHFLWTAASRAVRAPARLDRELRFPANPPYYIAGGPDFVSEVANVYEIGYRAQPSPSVTYSATLFHHDWDKLRSGQKPPNAQVQNMITGSSYGAEAWATWQVLPAWRLSGGATTLRHDLRLRPGSTDPSGPRELGDDPEYQWMLRSAFNLPRGQELDIAVRRVAALPYPAVPAYTAVDMRYGWKLSGKLQAALSAQNLFDPSHPEFNSAPGRSEIKRSFQLQLRWVL
jgi:iron complex outermembrane receptor protein